MVGAKRKESERRSENSKREGESGGARNRGIEDKDRKTEAGEREHMCICSASLAERSKRL